MTTKLIKIQCPIVRVYSFMYKMKRQARNRESYMVSCASAMSKSCVQVT